MKKPSSICEHFPRGIWGVTGGNVRPQSGGETEHQQPAAETSRQPFPQELSEHKEGLQYEGMEEDLGAIRCGV